MKDRQYMLIILDGVGLRDEHIGNAVYQAKTPNLDNAVIKYASSHLKTSGLSVGLPDGQMGNSEVGHTTIGAGRVIYQDLVKISKQIESGEFYENPAFIKVINHVKSNDSKLHIFGLLSDGGVHSHIEHIKGLANLAKNYDITKVYIHAFMDGRDTSPVSGIEYIKDLQNHLDKLKIGKIATISGRFYAMDRDKRWDRTKKAYDAIVNGQGKVSSSAECAILDSYKENITDEFVIPTVIVDEKVKPIAKLESGDAVIFANFRPDRARQISHAIMDKDFDGFIRKDNGLDNIQYVCMTEYDKSLENVDVTYEKEEINNTLGEVLSQKGYTQLRISETEKYAHVTFFLNGGREKEFDGEKRILVPSPKVETYDLKPEMSAIEVTDNIINVIKEGNTDCIIVNFANGDMVGHTGSMEAAIKAMETVDECLGKILKALDTVSGEAIIIADHGNCEQMIDLNTGEPITTHTTFDVPIVVVSNRVKAIKSGSLADVAPTILTLMGEEIPKEMTGKPVITLK